MASTCHKKHRSNKINKNFMESISTHVLSYVFHRFYVSTSRLWFGKIKNNATVVSTHEALKDAHVHETILCVTFGALHFQMHFASLYSMFKLCSDSYASGHTCPPDHAVRSVWRAAPFGSAEPIGPPLGPPDRQGRPRSPERVRLGIVWPTKITQ